MRTVSKFGHYCAGEVKFFSSQSYNFQSVHKDPSCLAQDQPKSEVFVQTLNKNRWFQQIEFGSPCATLFIAVLFLWLLTEKNQYQRVIEHRPASGQAEAALTHISQLSIGISFCNLLRRRKNLMQFFDMPCRSLVSFFSFYPVVLLYALAPPSPEKGHIWPMVKCDPVSTSNYNRPWVFSMRVPFINQHDAI